MKEQWIIGDSLKTPKLGFPETPKELSFAAGSKKKQAHANIVACDTEMQENYNKNHIAIGQHIYPFLYSEFTPDGGRYTLLINDSDWVSAKPTPPLYEITKSVSHTPLGIWSIISRYAAYPEGGQWVPDMTQYNQTLLTALDTIQELDLDTEVTKNLRAILKRMSELSSRFIGAKTFSMEAYSKAANSINKELVFLQSLAADIQVAAFTTTLEKWKTLVGEKEWEKLYVVISAQWTLSTENVHQLIIANTMASKELAAKNIFVTSLPLENIDEARALCGRVVGDRIMSYQTLTGDTKRGEENIYSLSTSRDLISKAAEESIDKLMELCPHLNPK
jgi:hypothetical protein